MELMPQYRQGFSTNPRCQQCTRYIRVARGEACMGYGSSHALPKKWAGTTAVLPGVGQEGAVTDVEIDPED